MSTLEVVKTCRVRCRPISARVVATELARIWSVHNNKHAFALAHPHHHCTATAHIATALSSSTHPYLQHIFAVPSRQTLPPMAQEPGLFSVRRQVSTLSRAALPSQLEALANNARRHWRQ